MISSVETRQLDRDSLFLMACLRVKGEVPPVEYRVKARNLSSGGMMAEGPVSVARGDRVEVQLRNLGWVQGSVAWKQGTRFGIAFDEKVDPKSVRGMPVADGLDQASIRDVRPLVDVKGMRNPEKMRKI